MSIHKAELVADIAQKLKSYGYRVYVSKNGEYGFYTNGTRVVCFGGCWNFSVDFSGNYRSTKSGTGWQIAKDCGDIDAETAERFIHANAPDWAVRGDTFTYTTPEQHLKTYGASSGYTEV